MRGPDISAGLRSGAGRISSLSDDQLPFSFASNPRPGDGKLLPTQGLIRKHLRRVSGKLFAEFTGLRFHVAWKSAALEKWDVHSLPSGRSVCFRLSGSRHLRGTLASGGGHCFTCRRGVRNYWLSIRVCGTAVVSTRLQALERWPGKLRKPKTPAGTGQNHFVRRGAIVLSRREFGRAAGFLYEIVQYLQAASLSDMRKASLAAAGAVEAIEPGEAHLREAPGPYTPATPTAARSVGRNSNVPLVVRELLERIESDFAKAITLQGLARELNMNAAYLSSLFSRGVGAAFKTHLTELRIRKAKGLLGDFTKTISEVAFATATRAKNGFVTPSKGLPVCVRKPGERRLRRNCPAGERRWRGAFWAAHPSTRVPTGALASWGKAPHSSP